MFAKVIRLPYLLLVCALTLLSGCSAEKALALLNAVLPDGHYKKTLDVEYGTNARQKMDFYVPIADKIDTQHSDITVVFVYGGAWRTGQKSDYEFIAESLTREGFNVLIPDYRLYPEVKFPEFVNDIADAIAVYEKSVRSIKDGKNESGAGSRLVLMGHSSGAHQAAMLFTDKKYLNTVNVSSDVVGFIGLSGPYDLPRDLTEVAVVFPESFDELTVNPITRTKIWTDNTRPRGAVLLLHGEDDERVLVSHTTRFAEALNEAGVEVDVARLSGGHARVVIALSTPLQFTNDSLSYVTEFLNTIN